MADPTTEAERYEDLEQEYVEAESGDEEFEDALEDMVRASELAGLNNQSLKSKTESFQSSATNELPELEKDIEAIKDSFEKNLNVTADERSADDTAGKDSEREVDIEDLVEGEENEESSGDEERGEEEDDTTTLEQRRLLEEQMTEEEIKTLKAESQTLKEEGNSLFRADDYTGAIQAYTKGLGKCPLQYSKDRAIMYSNRAASMLHLGDNKASIEDCTKALELNPHYMKALLRRAELYEKTEKLDEALADYQKVIEMDPLMHHAREACMRLPKQIEERNEKLKTEMMGKLKDLGNLILRPFGLSTDNFNLQQDPNSGGYSVNFQQNVPAPQQPPPEPTYFPPEDSTYQAKPTKDSDSNVTENSSENDKHS